MTARPHRRNQRRSDVVPRLVTWLGLSLLLHALLVLLMVPLWPHLKTVDSNSRAIPVTLVLELPDPVPDSPEEPDDPDYHGQIVDVAPPLKEERPVDSDYLAEYDRTVEDETRVEEFRINPEVLADAWSPDEQLQFEDLLDLDVTEPSTGAEVGNDRFDPDRDGTLASLPSPFTFTNKEGLQKPVPASHMSRSLAGAPSNDLLDEKLGDRVALNTREILFAAYVNRIKRLVSFYFSQNMDNLPRSVVFSKSRYGMVAHVVLDGNGALEFIEVTETSGLPPLDNALVEAFRTAGPFPNPPEQLIAKDGRVYLPRFVWEVGIGQARAPFTGVDPRQNVQFPGILKTPR